MVVFDKTGTLTCGRPVVARMSLLVSLEQFPKDLIVWLLASAESGSEHPLARAILGYAQKELQSQEYGRCLEFELFPGLGLKSRISCRDQTKFGKYYSGYIILLLSCLIRKSSTRITYFTYSRTTKTKVVRF